MTLLLLAGTAEARRIAWGLTDSGVKVIASLAGVTRHPEPLPVPTRFGGFGGEDGFRAYLAEHDITAVLDATHPFAHRITDRTAQVCVALNLPYVHFLRSEWQAERGDNWTLITRPVDAAAHIAMAATVFLATGPRTLPEYSNLEGRRVLVRVVDPPTAAFPFEGGEFVIGRPPFMVESEMELFDALGVTHLVVKNAGGSGGRAKLDAARNLGLPVLMLQRPLMPDAVRVETVQKALDWVAAL